MRLCCSLLVISAAPPTNLLEKVSNDGWTSAGALSLWRQVKNTEPPSMVTYTWRLGKWCPLGTLVFSRKIFEAKTFPIHNHGFFPDDNVRVHTMRRFYPVDDMAGTLLRALAQSTDEGEQWYYVRQLFLLHLKAPVQADAVVVAARRSSGLDGDLKWFKAVAEAACSRGGKEYA